jgi:hypothetical protein
MLAVATERNGRGILAASALKSLRFLEKTPSESVREGAFGAYY